MARYKNLRRKRWKRTKTGVPVGYRENWKYVGRWSEKKVAPRTWRFKFRATKGRKARSYGGLGKGTKGKWFIKGIQKVIKTGKGKYQTIFTGTKKSMGFKVKKQKRKY